MPVMFHSLASRLGLASFALFGLSALLSAPACTTHDCSDDRLDTVRCVGNRIEFCLATEDGNRLGYEDCSSRALFCSDAHQACVTEAVLRGAGGEGGTGGAAGGMGGIGGAGGMAGAGGMGGMAGMGGIGGTPAVGGMGGAGGTAGGGGMGDPLLNGCQKSMATDMKAVATVPIGNSGLSYTPACVIVDAGTDVTMNLNFAIHPTVPGTVVGNTTTPDNTSPIPTTQSGTTVLFTMPNAGSFPYYCSNHFSGGMMGVIYVE
jgi:plastocyanin